MKYYTFRQNNPRGRWLYGGYDYASGRVSHDFWVVDSQGCIKLKVSYSRGELATLD